MRSTALWSLVATAAALTAGAPRPARAQATAPLDRAAWLAGCWEHRAGTRVTSEMWMPAAGGLMLGAGRTVEGDSARQWEHLRLRAEGDRLVYTAIPSGQTETSFSSASAEEKSTDVLTFTNPVHDFPQRITYRRLGEDSLVVRVEGPGPDGGTRGFDQPMGRVPCAPSGAVGETRTPRGTPPG